MSTLGYAVLTNVRDDAPPSEDPKENKPGVSSYVDAMAALVPAEVLALHAVILTFTTSIIEVERSNLENNAFGTIITEPSTLYYSFLGLLFLTIVLYVLGRGFNHLDKWDWARAGIPPLAFCFWTMLQKSTAFDAVWPNLPAAPRAAIALFGAALLGALAAWLARKASEHNPQNN